jgi:cell division protein FtsB
MKPATIFIGTLFALLAVLQYKLWVSPEGVTQFWKLKNGITQVNKENAILVERNTRVATEVKDLKEGIDAIEERARDDFGLVKPGEVFYQIVE